MKKAILGLLAVLVVALAGVAFSVTRDGERIVPVGEGTVVLEAGEFEAFPLPGSVTKFLPEDHLSYFVEVEPGIKVHVLEMGSGFPVYLQHGNPTWGFLYREVVDELPTDRMRVILPTLVGLGYSTKVPASEHTLENHIRWTRGVLEQLELEELVFVGQDWGGPVGMGALARSPELLRGAVILNTFLNPVAEEGELSPGHRMARNPVLGEMFLEFFVSLYRNLPQTQGDPASLPPEILEVYRVPVEEGGNRKAVVAMMRMVPDGPAHPTTAHMVEIEDYVQVLDIPAEIVWGSNDSILAGELAAMRENFPGARVTETDAGHFLQEEVPREIAEALVRVVAEVQARQLAAAGAPGPGDALVPPAASAPGPEAGSQ